MSLHRLAPLMLLVALLVAACQKQEPAQGNIFANPDETQAQDTYDLPQIQDAGELIAITMSGPDTYYEYRGQGFGLQFLMAEDFAQSIGVRLRMEIAQDTAELVRRLQEGDVDLIAMEMPPAEGLTPCGSRDTTGHNRWMVRAEAPLLAKALDKWWSPERRRQSVHTSTTQHTHAPARRSPQPAMLSAADGVISHYDDLFQQAAQVTGWDWRLIAAQCYQESAFDPQARSWAGAQGLMQLMPGTASSLGVSGSDVYDPKANVAAAARYIRQLQNSFSDIPSRAEQINFVLAAYNGGAGHIRDAMALTKKHGGDPKRWSSVRTYILSLSDPRYYRDPVVRYGYLRGTETDEYVRLIQDRWAAYRGSARPSGGTGAPAPSRRHVVDGVHQSQVRSADEYLGEPQ